MKMQTRTLWEAILGAVAVEIMAGRPAAKEVGMGNPAEKNDRTPDMCIVGDHLPLARNFSRIRRRQVKSVAFSDASACEQRPRARLIPTGGWFRP